MKRTLLVLSMLLSVAASSHAANVAVVGAYDPHQAQLEAYLTTSGHTVVRNPGSYAGFDAVILVRTDGSTALAEYVRGGGCLVTEYDAATWAADNLVDVDVAFLSGGSNVPVTFTAAGLASGLADGIPNPYSDGDRTGYFYAFSNLGPGVEALATVPGDATVTVASPVGAGQALLIAYDWSDQFASASADSQALVQNALATCGALPATVALPADVPALDARGLLILAALLAAAAIAIIRH